MRRGGPVRLARFHAAAPARRPDRRRGVAGGGGRAVRHPGLRTGRGRGARALPDLSGRLPRRRRAVRRQGLPVAGHGALGTGGGAGPGRVLGRGAGAGRHGRVPARADRAARQREVAPRPGGGAAARGGTDRHRQPVRDRPDRGRRRPRRAPEGHGAGGTGRRGRGPRQDPYGHGRPEVRPVPHRRGRTARRHPDPGPAAARTDRPALPHRLPDHLREALPGGPAPHGRADGPHPRRARRRPARTGHGRRPRHRLPAR